MTAFARSYAQAFLQTAPPGYDVERFLEGAAAVRDAVAGDARLKAFFLSPSVPLTAKKGTLALLAKKGDVDDLGARLLDLALEHGRVLSLSEILTAIRLQSDKTGGVVAARVTVARPVGDAERGKIAEALGRRVGRRVRLEVDVDATILGGFVAKVGSEVFDASVRHAVERFSELTKERAGA
jgi:F-type H+-transporting ATPase subunit delta